MVDVVEVKTKKQLKEFIRLPWKIYADDPNWVPPLLMELKDRLNRKKNPFFQHAEAVYYLAYRDGEVVGRIAAIVDDNHNKYHNEKTGFWGFFESINDEEVAKALFDTAVKWLKEKGMNTARGPASFGSNDEWGLLVDGFDTPPFVMMTHNPRYYVDLVERYGFTKAMDLYAWKFIVDRPVPEKIIKLVERVKQKLPYTIRTLNMKKIDEDVEKIRDVYISAWKDNWGFVPMTDDEFKAIAEVLKTLVYPELVIIVEDGDNPVAMSVTIHNINEVLIKYQKSKAPLWWIEIAQLLSLAKRLYFTRKGKKFQTARLLLAGIKPEYRRKGIDIILYGQSFITGKKLGYKYGELSWTLESNRLINEGIKKMGGEIYKTYRIYDLKI